MEQGPRVRRFIVGVLVAVLAVGCIQHKTAVAPDADRPWTALTTEHFTLSTDLDEAAALRIVGGLEETYALLGRAIFGSERVPSFHTDAVVFEYQDDLLPYAGDDVAGLYITRLPNDIEPQPTILASGSLSPRARILFAHELAHRFHHVAVGPMPVWLNEGLAQYYQAIRGEGGEPILGEIDERYMCKADGRGDMVCAQYLRLNAETLPQASALVRLDAGTFYSAEPDEYGKLSREQQLDRARHYGSAWLLVHMLMHDTLPYAETFRRTLAGPVSRDKGNALARILLDVPPGTPVQGKRPRAHSAAFGPRASAAAGQR